MSDGIDGWFEDPDDPTHYRFFDGETWTDERMPRPVASTALSAGWHLDPKGRHEYRYYDGSKWTDHVSDDGKPTVELESQEAPGGVVAESPESSTDQVPGPLLLGVILRPGTTRVSSVVEGGVADRRGLVAGDLITRVDGVPVSTPEQIHQVLQRLDLQVPRPKSVALETIRGPVSRSSVDSFGDAIGRSIADIPASITNRRVVTGVIVAAIIGSLFIFVAGLLAFRAHSQPKKDEPRFISIMQQVAQTPGGQTLGYSTMSRTDLLSVGYVWCGRMSAGESEGDITYSDGIYPYITNPFKAGVRAAHEFLCPGA